MNWLLALIKLIPYVAAGIQLVHADLPVEGKIKAAQDALSVAVSAAQATLSPEHAELATAIGETANTTISSIVTALHNAAPTK